MRFHVFGIVFFMFVLGQSLDAQSDTTVKRKNDSSDAFAPRIYTSDSTGSEGAKKEPSHFKPTKSPLLAVTLSMIVPGAGQVYDGGYWKVPIIAGLGGYWISIWISDNRNYQNYRGLYSASITTINPGGNSNYMSERDFYRDDRDRFSWYLGVLYLANVLDAYIGAHLYDFDVTPNLSAKDGSPQVGVAMRWRLGE